MNKRRFLILFVFTLICGIKGFSQQEDIKITYDLNGNRISRYVFMISSVENNAADSLSSVFRFSNSDPIIDNIPEKLEQIKISLFPNPNDGRFRVILDDYGKIDHANISIFSMQGAAIYQREITEASTEIDITNHENGTYFLTICINEQKKTWKVIKQ